MHSGHFILRLTYTVMLGISLSLAFNIDTKNPERYTGSGDDFFGYQVLQFNSGTDKGIIVSAPLQNNGSGGICNPDQSQSQSPHCFNPEEISVKYQVIPVKLLGMSLTADSLSSQFLVCSPNMAHECNQNSYLNSVCYKMNHKLQQISNFTPTFQECTKKTVDLLFLFDGSASMTEDEFNENKKFILHIMDNLKNTSIKFAGVQFSSEIRLVFDFNDYQHGSAREKLLEEEHMQDLTNTYEALKFVLDDVLENQTAGASSDSSKVVVIITDGDPSDGWGNNTEIVKLYDAKGIIRFVIGVKQAKMEKFTAIASQPKEKYAFKIGNYSGLTGILENFQNRIFRIEGSSGGGDLTYEMSQSGFSAVVFNDTVVLGSVGSNSWQGSLREIREGKEIQIQDPGMKNDSYLGYSIAAGQKGHTPVLFSGAPRFMHKGRIVVFTHNGSEWNLTQTLDGVQIGSYFGAELCSVDIDSDGDTDFLLVGAPQFYQPLKSEGLVHVYSLTDKVTLEPVLNVTVPSISRFGTTISSLADLNGDGLRDVAVGAPLEDENRGAVYIYLGDRWTGIHDTPSQRIMGREFGPGWRFFGQAIDGSMDLGDDGLPDIVVGSKGAVVVLRSNPVVNVTARLSFEPEEVSIDHLDCVIKTHEILHMANLTVCFDMVEITKSKAGVMDSGLNISYTLNVDHMREQFRGFFDSDKNARTLSATCNLKDYQTCFSYTVNMPKCVKDTLSPVGIKLNFAQEDSESGRGVLNMYSGKVAVVEVPFEKQCAKKNCVAELEVDFNFTSPTLLVTEDNYFNMSIQLSNQGDNSYNTNLTMFYPPGLSFSRMTLIKATRVMLHTCHDMEGVFDRTVCGISLPVYRSKSVATYLTSFYIKTGHQWNDSVSIMVTASSDNTNVTGNMTKSIQVQFEIKMAITVREGSTTYLNFSADSASKKMEIIYKIANPGLRAFPVNVDLLFPTKLEHNFELKDYQVSGKQKDTDCSFTAFSSKLCPAEKDCRIMECDAFILDKQSTTEIVLSGEAMFTDLKQYAENMAFLKRYTGESGEVKFRSFIRVKYDGQRYVLDSRKQQMKDRFMQSSPDTGSWADSDPTMTSSEARLEFIIEPHRLLIIATGVGLGVLFLLIITIIMFKLGCFKRKKYHVEERMDAVLQNDFFCASMAVSQSEAADNAEQPQEEKSLLSNNEKNGRISAEQETEILE